MTDVVHTSGNVCVSSDDIFFLYQNDKWAVGLVQDEKYQYLSLSNARSVTACKGVVSNVFTAKITKSTCYTNKGFEEQI